MSMSFCFILLLDLLSRDFLQSYFHDTNQTQGSFSQRNVLFQIDKVRTTFLNDAAIA